MDVHDAAKCAAFTTGDIALNAEYTKLTTKMKYTYATAEPTATQVEDLIYGKLVKFGISYSATCTGSVFTLACTDPIFTDQEHTFAARPAVPVPDPTSTPTPTVDGATAVTTMGSVLAAVSLFALAAW